MISKTKVVPHIVDREDVSFHLGEVVEHLATKYKLSRSMRQFFFVRLRFTTDTDAARALGMKAVTIKRWRNPSHSKDYVADFKGAYDEFFKTFEKSVEEDMRALLGKAKGRVDELLDAKKTIQTETGVLEVPDYDARFKGLQALFNWLGRWGSRQRVEINPLHVSVTEQFQKMLEARAEQLKLGAGEIIEGEVVESGENPPS